MGFFKKKDEDEDDFPFEEKAEILDDDEEDYAPEFPAEERIDFRQPREGMQQPLNFGEGFRSSEELMPPTQAHETQLPPFRAPEPLPTPRPEPRNVEFGENVGRMQSEFGALPRVRDKPHIFIKIDKYKDVMTKVRDLDEKINATKRILSKIEEKNKEEKETMNDAINVLLKIEKLVSYLEDTFTSTGD